MSPNPNPNPNPNPKPHLSVEASFSMLSRLTIRSITSQVGSTTGSACRRTFALGLPSGLGLRLGVGRLGFGGQVRVWARIWGEGLGLG